MNVDKVKFNNISSTAYGQTLQNRKNNVNFKGAASVSDVTTEINNLMPKKLRTIYKLGSGSELRDIIINSLGTAFLAPIFIKWNPLSKTDEDTRTYSAWRQPVSAALAVGTQGLITIPFDRIVVNMVNSGWFNDAHNKTAFKDEKYITKLVKNNHPEFTKERVEQEVSKIQKQQNEDLIRSIKEKDTITLQHANTTKTTQISSEEMRKYKIATLEDILKSETEELKKFNEVKIPQRIARSEYYRLHASEATKFLTDLQQEVNKAKDKGAIEKILTSKEKSLKGKAQDKELLNIVQELRGMLVYGKTEDAHTNINTKIDKIVKKHIPMYQQLDSKEAVVNTVKGNEDIIKRKAGLDGAIEKINGFLERLKNNENITSAQIEDEIKALIKNGDNNTSRLKKYEEFTKLVAEKYKSTIEANIKGFKRISGLLVATLMLPVSCWLLNWVYPRFMDAVFPNLSNKKHSNEAHEYIDKANQNGEVHK